MKSVQIFPIFCAEDPRSQKQREQAAEVAAAADFRDARTGQPQSPGRVPGLVGWFWLIKSQRCLCGSRSRRKVKVSPTIERRVTVQNFSKTGFHLQKTVTQYWGGSPVSYWI